MATSPTSFPSPCRRRLRRRGHLRRHRARGPVPRSRRPRGRLRGGVCGRWSRRDRRRRRVPARDPHRVRRHRRRRRQRARHPRRARRRGCRRQRGHRPGGGDVGGQRRHRRPGPRQPGHLQPAGPAHRHRRRTRPHRLEPRRPRRPRGLGLGGRRRAPPRGPAALGGCRQPHPRLHAPRRGPLRADRRGAPAHLRHGPVRSPTSSPWPSPTGCDVVVATDGARGSSALTATGETAYAPAHTGTILSTLGAGDVFHGALVAAVVKGLALDQQLAFANVTAALSCRGLDGRSRIPSLAEVEAAMPANAR